MTALDALLLGIIQGLTEFLPVSSSGHLKLAEYFLGLKDLDQYILFDLSCHLGTLLAVTLFFFQVIKNTFQNKTLFWQLVIGTMPLMPLVFLMKPIKAMYADLSYLGFFFILTAMILFLGSILGKRALYRHSPRRDALAIGLCQALAILPGVSRSGSTISGARALGWSPDQAVTFSFLLAIPAILGGTFFEVLKIWQQPDVLVNIHFTNYAIGFAVSFLIGIFALMLLMRIVSQEKFHYFGWYCLFLGIATAYYFHN